MFTTQKPQLQYLKQFSLRDKRFKGRSKDLQIGAQIKVLRELELSLKILEVYWASYKQ
jgi:hypothetical protein